MFSVFLFQVLGTVGWVSNWQHPGNTLQFLTSIVPSFGSKSAKSGGTLPFAGTLDKWYKDKSKLFISHVLSQDTSHAPLKTTPQDSEKPSDLFFMLQDIETPSISNGLFHILAVRQHADSEPLSYNRTGTHPVLCHRDTVESRKLSWEAWNAMENHTHY